MLFVCDIGNTNIKTGVFAGDKLLFRSDFSSASSTTVDELAITIRGAFSMHKVDPHSIDGAIISSVVRPITRVAISAIELLMQIKPLIVGPGVKTGLNIKTDMPSQIGADIVAAAVGSQIITPRSDVVLSMGTATTLSVTNKQYELCGVVIAPGIGISSEALSARAAELPQVAPAKPVALLGRNTIDSMISGITYGAAAMIDGLLNRIAAEEQIDTLEVIATGTYAQTIMPYVTSGHHIRYDDNLIFAGLKRIYQLNSK